VSDWCAVTAAAEALGGGVARRGSATAQGSGDLPELRSAGFCSHLLISVLLLVTKFLLLYGVEQQFSFHSFAEFMGILRARCK